MSKVANRIKETAILVRSKIQRRSKPTLSFPLRTLSNVKYRPEKGFLELKGKKKTRTLTVATVKTFAQTLRMMSQAKTLVEDDEIMTKREAYYVSKNWDDARF
ncbi:MAG: DNA topoisomerase IV subunit A, partial [Planctomycetota bacterium]